MKKRSIAWIFLINFLKAAGIIALLGGVGAASYFVTTLFYDKTERVERSTSYTHVISVNTGNESSNLIYSYDAETKKINAIVLELFDSITKNLSYITIPANTRISISGSTYEDLLEVSQKLPQLSLMSEVNDYFSGDVAYEYGILMLQENLKADIGYFTALSSDKFNEYFENAGSKKKPKYKPSQKLIDSVKSRSTEKDMKNLMEEKWDELISDITLSQKQKYAKALSQINTDFIRIYRAYGTQNGKVFELDKKKNKKLINNIWESEAYTYAQNTEKNTARGHSIYIMNASEINGLAAGYQKRLETDGFKVLGVGNYEGSRKKKTMIYAKNKKWGKGLQTYFPGAAVKKKKDLSNGADIEIILGTDAGTSQ